MDVNNLCTANISTSYNVVFFNYAYQGTRVSYNPYICSGVLSLDTRKISGLSILSSFISQEFPPDYWRTLLDTLQTSKNITSTHPSCTGLNLYTAELQDIQKWFSAFRVTGFKQPLNTKHENAIKITVF
jgi:hypothetical protein